MIKNRKTIIYAVVAVFIIAIATMGMILFLNSNNNKASSVKTKTPVTSKSITTLTSEAISAQKSDNTTEAKALLSEARQKLSEQPTSDANTNALVNNAAQQCMAGVKSACRGY